MRRTWKSGAGVALATVVLGTVGVMGAQPAPAEPAAMDAGYYTIRNVNSGLNLGISGGSTANGGKVAQWDPATPGTNFDQLWYATSSTTRLKNVNSGKYMGVWGQSKDNWANIVQWSGSGNADQLWRIETIRGLVVRIRNVNSNKCLAIPWGTHEWNTQAIQYTCNGGVDQEWRMNLFSK